MTIDPVRAKATLACDVLKAWEPRFSFDAKRHTYTLDGESIPSVTTVAGILDKPQIFRWGQKVQQEADSRVAWRSLVHVVQSGQMPDEAQFHRVFRDLSDEEMAAEKARKKAADLGTEVHALIEAWCKAALGQDAPGLDVSPEAEWVFSGWEEWAKSVAFRPYAVEQRVAVPGVVAGTLDCLGVIDGELAVIDWKTSKGGRGFPYPEQRLQSAAYRTALWTMGGPQLAGYVVRLPKDGQGDQIEHVRMDDKVDVLWEYVIALARIYAWRKEVG